jgi:hypothetical protein
MRMRVILVSLAAAGAVSVGSTAAMAAPATASWPAAKTALASVAPAFTCPGRSVCLFSGDKLNGSVQLVPPNEFGRWVPAVVATQNGKKVHAGSAHNNTKGIFWVYSITTKARECIGSGKRPDLNHTYGWIYVKEHTPSCKGQSLPEPLP